MKLFNKINSIIGVILLLTVVACATRTQPAPIVNVTQTPNYAVLSTPIASAVESVSQADLKALPDDNGVQVSAGSKNSSVQQPVVSNEQSNFLKPTEGDVSVYSSTSKGVNIFGSTGQVIYAAQSGKVLYSGSGLKGYGNLIIIKHDNGYLSAYAYNQINYVKEGELVKRGQKIAAMGNNSGRAMLHFEIRKNGKPLDPTGLISN